MLENILRLFEDGKKYAGEGQGYTNLDDDCIEWLINRAKQAAKMEETLHAIAHSKDDSSCNELALKYEVMADQALCSE